MEPSQNSPPSPERPSKVVSPPNSVSGQSNTSSDGFDHPAGISTESSRLTSYSSYLMENTKSVEENGKTVDIATEMAAPAEKSNLHDDGGTTPVPVNSCCRVRHEHVSVRTLKAYHIDHFIDAVSNRIPPADPADILQDPDYVVIARIVPDYEMEFLKRHTEELRKIAADPAPPQFEAPSATPFVDGSSGSFAPPDPQGSIANAEVQPSAYFKTTDHTAHPLGRPPSRPPPGVRPRPFPNAPPSTVSDRSSKVKDADLLVQVNKVPFSKWLEGQAEDNKRGKSVLDVAMQAREAVPPKPSGNQPNTDNSVNFDTVLTPEVPVRLAINSELLQNQLNKITKFDLNEDNKVMYPPWKVIVTYEKEFRTILRELQEKASERDEGSIKKEEEKPNLAPIASEEVETDLERKTDELAEDEVNTILKPCEVCDKHHETKLGCLKDIIGHLKCFVDFIDSDLKHVFAFRQGVQDCTIKEIAFEDLWHLFTPGDLLITSGETHARQAYKVFYTSGGRPTVQKNADFFDDGPRSGSRRQKSARFEKIPITTPFTIHCYYIDFDRKWLGPAHQTITIPRYEGKRPIMGLTMAYSDPTSRHPASAFPIRYLEEREAAVAKLVKRGKRHRQVTPFSHKKYIGPSSVVDPEFVSDCRVHMCDRR